jgi:hypothetical protein
MADGSNSCNHLQELTFAAAPGVWRERWRSGGACCCCRLPVLRLVSKPRQQLSQVPLRAPDVAANIPAQVT